MRKILWFLVGFFYFVLIWLNRAEITSSIQFAGVREVGSWVALLAWSGVLLMACRETWKPSELVIAPKLRRLSVAGLGSLTVQYGLGAVSRNRGAGLSCPDFPKCAEGFFPFNFESSIAFAHRWWGILMLGLFFHIAIAALKSAPELLPPARRISGLSLAQVFLGIGVVMTQLNPDSRLIHVAMGYALWGHLLFILARTGGMKSSAVSQR